jgi:predicted O-methyltransferase YrrM
MRHRRLRRGAYSLGKSGISRILQDSAHKRAKIERLVAFLIHRSSTRKHLATIKIPADLETVLNNAWEETRKVPGHLGENESRFLGLLAACVPARGTIVEIGSFKGRSTVMLAKVASHYGLGPIVAIDPHNSPILLDHQANPEASSYQDFLNSIHTAGVSNHVESHVGYSTDVARSWNRPIRLLWIDGDHSYEGAKKDLDRFFPHLVPGGVVAFHDALNAFPGPIRVFVEDVLRSDRFGPAGFVHSIAWAQFRAEDGHTFRERRLSLARRAARLIPFVESSNELHGMAKRLYKLNRFLVPHSAIDPEDWASLVDSSPRR